MLDKLTDTVEVRTFLDRVHCPNPGCIGLLESDGHTRTEGNVHGGKIEYRHRCQKCEVGYWLKAAYPKVRYEQITPDEPVAIKRNTPPHHKGPRTAEGTA